MDPGTCWRVSDNQCLESELDIPRDHDVGWSATTKCHIFKLNQLWLILGCKQLQTAALEKDPLATTENPIRRDYGGSAAHPANGRQWIESQGTVHD